MGLALKWDDKMLDICDHVQRRYEFAETVEL